LIFSDPVYLSVFPRDRPATGKFLVEDGMADNKTDDRELGTEVVKGEQRGNRIRKRMKGNK
jgi:hypothetical protein